MKRCTICQRTFPDDTTTCPEHGDTLRADPMLGQKIGSFVIERFLAEGGLGQVYVAEHTEIRRKVAFKVVRPDQVGDPSAIQRFFQEARVVSRLGHPHLIDIFDIGQTADGRVYYVMELLEGRTLSERMAKQPLRFAEFVPILVDVCSALEAAHAQNIIHRDLKPDNLFLVERAGEPPFVKILDFGIAKVLTTDAALEGNLTKTGNLVGTPQYMAPEQIEGLPIDARTDLYALGVIMYQLATRALPFRGQTLGAMLKAHLLEMPPRFTPTVTALGVPAGFEAVVRRALAKNANDRYANATALRADLERVMRGEMPEAQAWWQAQPDGAPMPSQKLDASAPTMAFNVSDLLGPNAMATLPTANISAPVSVPGSLDPADAATMPPSAPTAPPTASVTPLTAPPGPVRRNGKIVTGVFLGLVGATAISAFTFFQLRKNHPKTKQAMQQGPSLATYKSQALSTLTASLGDGDPAIRKQAIEGIAGTRDARHAGLIELKLKDADISVRATAATALGVLGARDATATLRTAETGRENVAAYEALMALGDDSAETKLKSLLASPDESVKGAAALALGNKDPRALSELERQIGTATVDETQRLKALGKLCVAAPKWRDELVKLVDQSQPPLAVRALEPLVTCDAELGRERAKKLAEPTSTVRPSALRLLALLDDHSGFEAALTKATDATAPMTERVTAADVVGLSGEKSALPKLQPLMTDVDPSLRTASASAVLTILSRDPRALATRSVSWAASALNNQSPAMREQAALVLGDANAQVAIPLLGRALRDPQPEVRRAAVSSLGRTKSGAAAPLLDSALSDDKPDVRMTAIRSLGKLPATASGPVLKKHVSRGAASERILAAGQLVRFGDKDSVNTIRAALAEADPDVRRVALEVADAAPELASEASRAGLGDKDPQVRFAAALLAALQNNKDALPILKEGLTRGGTDALRAAAGIYKLGGELPAAFDLAATLDGVNAEGKRSAMQIAEKLPHNKGLLVWRRGLKDNDATVRMAALEAIGDNASDDAGALLFVKGALQDTDAGVRAKAGAILGRLAPPPAANEEPVEPEPTPPPAVADLASAPAADLAPRDAGADLAAVDLAPAAAAPVADLAPGAATKPVPTNAPPEVVDPKEEARLAMTTGELALRNGKIEQAITELERARKLNNKLPLYFSLGEAYRKRGDVESNAGKRRAAYERAIEHYQKSRDKRGTAYAAELTERLNEK